MNNKKSKNIIEKEEEKEMKWIRTDEVGRLYHKFICGKHRGNFMDFVYSKAVGIDQWEIERYLEDSYMEEFGSLMDLSDEDIKSWGAEIFEKVNCFRKLFGDGVLTKKEFNALRRENRE